MPLISTLCAYLNQKKIGRDYDTKRIPTKYKEIILGRLDQVSGVHLNVAQNYIVTTEDKLRIHLSKSARNVERRAGWIAPLGILISLVLSILTADFKDYGFGSATWEAIFIIGAVGSLIWLINALRVRPKSETVDQLIERIKKESK